MIKHFINSEDINFDQKENEFLAPIKNPINLNELIKIKDLEFIVMTKSSPSKIELLIAIKAKNLEASKLNINDFKFLGTKTSTQSTIIANGKYFGEVTLAYQKAINLNQIITNKDLKIIDLVEQIPNKSELLAAIKENNLRAKDLTIDYFDFEADQTTTRIKIIGCKKYWGTITLVYQKKSYDLNKIIKNKNLGFINFLHQEDEVEILPITKKWLLNKIENKNPNIEDVLTIDDFACQINMKQKIVTITGYGKYYGLVNLSFTLTGIDIKSIIKETNMGTISFQISKANSTPTIEMILNAP